MPTLDITQREWKENRIVSHCKKYETERERDKKQENPPIGGAVRNATSLISQRLSYIAITCSENVQEQFCSCITVDRDNNTTTAIIMGLEYNHCNEK